MRVRATDPMGFVLSPVIPNRPIRLELDRRWYREMLRWLLVIVVLAAALLFDARQRQGIVKRGALLEEVQSQRAAEEMKTRHLNLEIETLRDPARIEACAKALNLVRPGPRDAVVIERVIPPEQPPLSVVASR